MNLHYYPKLQAFVDLRPESFLTRDGQVLRKLDVENSSPLYMEQDEAMEALIPLNSYSLEELSELE